MSAPHAGPTRRPVRRPRPVRAGLPWLFAILWALALPATAMAHAELETATPGPGATIETQPGTLTATFTEAVDPAKSTIEVRDPAGTVVARSSADSFAADGLAAAVELPALANGVHEVRWTTAATDGHIERGTYTFTVAIPEPSPSPSPSPSLSPSPSAAPSPSPAASPSPAPSASPVASPSPPPDDGSSADDGGSIVIPLVVAGLAIGAFAGLLWRRRRVDPAG